MVVGACKISTKSQALHSSEKIRMIGQYIFKRAMPVAHFAHEDAPAFLQYFRIDDSWLFSKISDLILAPQNRLGCFAVAIGTQRRRFPGHTQFRRPSLCPLEQPSRGPLWCRQDSRS